MALEIGEREMINRLSDSMKEAADRANILASGITIEKPQALSEFLHALKVAAGSAHQLAIYRENLSLFNVRDTLEKVLEYSRDLPLSMNNSSLIWLSIRDSLLGIRETAIKSADAKAKARQEVLAELTFRQTHLKGTDREFDNGR